MPDLPKHEVGDGLKNVLAVETEDILEDKFVNPQNLKMMPLEI